MSHSHGRRAFVIVLALAAAGLPSDAWAQRRRQQGPALPSPTVQSVLPCGIKAGETVDINVRGSDLEGATTLWFDHPGLRAFHLKGTTFRVACAVGTPVGNHDVRAVGTYGLSNARTFVVGDRPETMEVEPNNLPAQATPIAVNSVVNGEVAMTDVDCFAFEGKAGRRLLVEVAGERIDSRLDATVRLFDPRGREIAESRDAVGVDPLLDATLPADGRYVVKLHDVVYRGSSDHVYRLTVTDGPYIDAIVPVAARAGESATFTLIGRNLGGEPAPELSIDGRPLEKKVVTLTAPESFEPDPSCPTRGHVAASGAPRRGFEYALETPSGHSNPVFIAEAVDPVVVENEPNDEPAKAQTVAVPSTISGCFAAPGDLDFYRFAAKKGDVLWIEASAQRIGSEADPVFLVQKIVEKGDPQEIATGDDSNDRGDPQRFSTRTVDAAVRVKIPDDGTYQVMINDLYGSQRGDVRLSYRLNVRPERPDFHLFVMPEGANTPDALTVPRGGRALASVLAVRVDGFSGPIRVEAVDLPEGVRCEPAVIAAGHATTPIVFEADEGAKPALGRARLIGHARFGDRKEDVGYISGATPLGPDVSHEAVGGEVVWAANPLPNQQQNPPAPSARLTRGFVLKVGEPAPLGLSARVESPTATPGGMLPIELSVARGEGFAEAVSVTLASTFAAPPQGPRNNPGNANASPPVPIAKGATTAIYPLLIPKNVPPGVYTVVLQGSGPFPFSKDAKAKTRPNVTISEPANPLTIVVRPAPATVALKANGSLKQGGSLDVEVTVTTKDKDAGSGPFRVALAAPAALKLSAEAVEATPGKPVKLVVKAAKDSPAGAAAGLAVRVSVPVRGEPVDVNEPVAVTIAK